MTNHIINFPFLVVDIETTGLSYKNNEIIEIGAVRFKPDGSKEEFSQFIKPVGEVPLFIYKLTGITNEQLRHADTARKVLSDFYRFINTDDIIVCHNADFDMPFLNYHLNDKLSKKIENPVIDTLVVSRIFTPFLKSHTLAAMAQYFDISLENAHRAIFDAEATGGLFYKLTDFITQYIKPEEISFMVTILEYIEKAKTTSTAKFRKNKVVTSHTDTDHLHSYLLLLRNYMIKFALTDKEKKENPFEFKHYNFIEVPPPTPASTPPHEPLSIDQVFSADGLFARTFDNYELREGQIQMSHAVQSAFEHEEFLLVEAGTGVGKSLAYLVPSLLFSKKTGKKIIISTNTKNLQEQLLLKDIPLLTKALNFIDFTAVLVKGRENYLCPRKWQELFEAFTLKQANISISPSEAFGILYLYLWAINTKTGDITENSSFQHTQYQTVLRKVSSDRHLCLGRKCRHHANCFLMQVRQKAENANILIVNHSLLFSDLQVEQPTLGDIEYLVVDEAHNLLQTAAEYLGFTLSYPDVNSFLSTIYSKKDYQFGMMTKLKTAAIKSRISKDEKETLVNKIDEFLNYMDNAKDVVELPFTACGEVAKTKGSYNKYRIKHANTKDTFPEHLKALQEHLHKIAADLRKIKNTIMAYEASKFVDQEVMLSFLEKSADRLSGLIEQCESLIDPNFEKYAFWYSAFETQADNYPDGVYNYAPIVVNDVLPDMIYRRIKSLVFTSATLSLRGSFKYFVTNMGLDKLSFPTIDEMSQIGHIDKTLQQKIVPSPFNYDKQTIIVNTAYLPQNTDSYFPIQAVGLIKTIIEQKPTGTLILFTSYKDLKMMYESIEQTCFEKDVLLLAQGISGSRNSILNRFIDDGKAILLGTSSFWEGVDVLGDSLSLLIVYKLPFAVPTEPIVEAYLEKLESEGKKSFMHYSLPNALLKMRQGIGRLIRSKTDTGAILILDNRISTKEYGQYFREIIPTKIHSTQNPVETIDYVLKILKG